MIVPQLQHQRRQLLTQTQTQSSKTSSTTFLILPRGPPPLSDIPECYKDPTHFPCFPPYPSEGVTYTITPPFPPSGTHTNTDATTTPSPTATAVSSAQSSTGTQIHPPPPHHPPPHQTNPARIAGVVVLVLAALGIFFWLFRRGTFGSGTLFGMKYGDARFEGRKKGEGSGGAGALALGRRQMQQKDGEQEYARVSAYGQSLLLTSHFLTRPAFCSRFSLSLPRACRDPDPDARNTDALSSSSTASLPPYPASLSNAKYASTAPGSPSAPTSTALSSTAISRPSTSHTPTPLLALPSHLIHARHAPQLSVPSSATLVDSVPKRAASPTNTTITEWSTSPSAFDKAYGMRPGSVGTHATGTSTTASVGSVSQPQQTGSSAFDPSRARDSERGRGRGLGREQEQEQEPPPYEDPFLAPHETGAGLARNASASSAASESRMSVETARTDRTDRTDRTGETEMSVRTGTSTVDGVRISSWHSSDSEGTELRGPVAGVGIGIGLR